MARSSSGDGYADLSDLLVRLGVRTLGDLAALPAPAVLGRFGAEGVAARRLALGLDSRPVRARTPPLELACSAEMDPPEQRVEAAAFVAKSLADELLARLDGCGLAATRVAIEAETEHGERLVRHWRHEGTLSPSALAERTRWQLEGWLSKAGPGGPTSGLTLLRLVPEEVHPDTGRQLGFWGGVAESDARATRAMARVQGLLGPEGVSTAVLDGARGFAEQVRLVPWGDARSGDPEKPSWSPPSARPRPGRKARGDSIGKRGEGPIPWPGRLADPSPALVHQPRRAAEVLDGAGRPVLVSARGAMSGDPAALALEGGPALAVRWWAGPWPLEERWWGPGGRRQARLQVVTETGEAHLVSREAGRWWVEATYG